MSAPQTLMALSPQYLHCSGPPPLTGSELRWQVALAQLLPALSTMGQFHVACHFQDGKTQTRRGQSRDGNE